MPDPAPIPREALLRLPEVLRLTALSETEVYRQMAASTFPLARKISSRAVAWQFGEVQDWIESRPRWSRSDTMSDIGRGQGAKAA